MFSRRNWLWTALLALPVTLAGVVYANSQARPGYVCPITGETLPCEKCCPLNQGKETYTCPITGEELPCPNCCPLNQGK
jgi:hypothetical protein